MRRQRQELRGHKPRKTRTAGSRQTLEDTGRTLPGTLPWSLGAAQPRRPPDSRLWLQNGERRNFKRELRARVPVAAKWKQPKHSPMDWGAKEMWNIYKPHLIQPQQGRRC